MVFQTVLSTSEPISVKVFTVTACDQADSNDKAQQDGSSSLLELHPPSWEKYIKLGRIILAAANECPCPCRRAAIIPSAALALFVPTPNAG